MTAAEIFSWIAQYGLSTVLCVIMMWYCKNLLEKDKEETKEFTKAITNNTAALNELKLLVNQLYLRVEKLDAGGQKNGNS